VESVSTWTLKLIERLISEGESERLEFKKSTGVLKAIAETLCAFLNGHGGRVLVGVSDQGKILGQDVRDHTKQDIAQMLRKFEPAVHIGVEYLAIPNTSRMIIVFEVNAEAQVQMPYCYEGRPYWRIESSTAIMPQSRYQQLLLARMSRVQSWETQISPQLRIQDLDEAEIQKTVKQGVQAGRIPQTALAEDVHTLLMRFGLATEDAPLNAAWVLFGTNLQLGYAQCFIKMARFRGTDKTHSFIDNRQCYGHAFELLEEALSFIQRHLPIASHFETGEIKRIDTPMLPLLAIREALVNSLCHRDWSQVSGEISLAIFDDRLEIWNNGVLPELLKPEDLKREHRSIKRNPQICEVFYLRNLIERWGTGTNRIVNECLAQGLPEPIFSEDSGGVNVTFFFKKPMVTLMHAPTDVEVVLTERQREILAILRQHIALSRRAIVQALGQSIADRTLKRELSHLATLGLIVSEGRGPSIVWRIHGG
jgi:ATP-dependent DNA helicase RecG